MSRTSQATFVDSGAWIALALTADPYHERARSAWTTLLSTGSRLVTSIPVVIETFTFLDRNASRQTAILWREEVTKLRQLQIVECSRADLTKSWAWFDKPGLLRLSAVDATSFTLMRRLKIRAAFAFDQHFAQAGFRVLG